MGYSNPRDAISKHVDAEDKGVAKYDTPGGVQDLTVINESGMYSLILGSRLPNARKFKHWVTSEVLPSIRKNGGYISGQEMLTDDELLEKAVLVARRKIAERDRLIARQRERIESDKPKTVFADAVSASRTAILIGELAKILNQNGIDIGEKRLFRWMRQEGYLIHRNGTDFNMPTQRSMELRLFRIRERTISNPDGSIRITKTVFVTGKGQQYFINKFLQEPDGE